MAQKSLIWAVIFLTLACQGQSQSNPDRKGMFKGNASFAQSYMLHYKNQNVYIYGDLEYFASSNVSVRGDCFWYLDTRNAEKLFRQNAMVLFGMMYNTPIKKSNFFAGIQPGISFTQPYSLKNSDVPLSLGYFPCLCVSAGYTLYFSKLSHFNLELKYVSSRYRGTTGGSLNIDEFMVSGGLGFQIGGVK